MPKRLAYVGTAGISGSAAQQSSNFGSGTHTFTPSRSGRWKIVAWGAGGGTSAGSGSHGSSAGYGEKTVRLTTAQSVTIVVGAGVSATTGQTTTITFPDASTLVCTGGAVNGGAAGTSTGGDTNLSGSIGAASAGTSPAGGGTGGGLGGSTNGAGAPANLPYHGGDGGGNLQSDGGAPGAGSKTTASAQRGGDGLALAVFISD